MIRLRVPGSLTYRHLALRVVAAACKMAAPSSNMAAPASKSASRAAAEALHGACLESTELGTPADDFEAQTLSAVGEAFNNIAIHAYRAGPPGDVDIEIESDEDGIVIRLMDTGLSFDPESVSTPKMEDLPESGMGLFIITSFMDEVEYRPGRPNVLRLAKRRETRSCLSGGGDAGEEDANADFDDPSDDPLASGQSGFRIRSVAQTSPQRAAGGIKIQ